MEKRTFALFGLSAVAAAAALVSGFLLMGVGPADLREEPALVSAVFDDAETFTALNGPEDVEVFEQGGRAYAIVTSFWDDGIQITDITDPAAPSPVSAVFDDTNGFAALNGPGDVEVFEQGGGAPTPSRQVGLMPASRSWTSPTPQRLSRPLQYLTTQMGSPPCSILWLWRCLSRGDAPTP